MATTDLTPLIQAARAYEELFVPALFAPWGPIIIESAGIAGGDNVLDVGCGTGVLARAIAETLGKHTTIKGIDPAPGMVAVAKELDREIEWIQGSADALPFADATFDVVVSQFAMMFFSDRVASLQEMLRVLKPGGRMAVAVWDGIESNEAYRVEADLLERLAGREAAEAIRIPYNLGNPEKLWELGKEAGLTKVEVKTHGDIARFPSIRVQLEAELRGWLPLMGVNLEEEKIQEVLTAAEDELQAFVGDDGKTNFQVSAHLLSGCKQ